MMQRVLSIISESSISGSRSIFTNSKMNDIFKVQSQEDFDAKVLKSSKPIIVDFFATWCAPCRMLTPRIESIINEEKNQGKIEMAKIDIDELTDLALEYDIQSVPVLMVIRDGKVHKKMVGLQDTDKLRAFVENAIGGK